MPYRIIKERLFLIYKSFRTQQFVPFNRLICVRTPKEINRMNGKELENFIKRAKKGDAHAFGIVCGGLSQDAYRFALFYMKNPHDAEDAVQDACLKAWQKLPDLKKTEAFRTWFFKILSNICKSSLSSLKVVVPTEEIPDAPAEKENTELKIEMRELLESLPPDDRRIVLLSVVAGFSSREIAVITGSNANTVRSRLSRALRSLKAQISTEVQTNETAI